jgi:4-hydroxybenzoate polyprenyltransferase
LAWVACLNGGTLAINSAFDRDEGDIAYLRNPPPPPRHLFEFGLALMAVGQGIALLLPRGYTVAYAICFGLSVLYSVPPFRLKSVAGADWLINMWGFGALTPYAGWAATGRPLEVGPALVILGFCPLFAALYPLTQLYQLDEDRARGDRTLALRLGTRRSLDVAIGGVLVAFALFATAQALADRSGWRWVPPAAGLAAWIAVLLPWRVGHARYSAGDHQRGMYLALGAWAATDLGVLLAWAA